MGISGTSTYSRRDGGGPERIAPSSRRVGASGFSLAASTYHQAIRKMIRKKILRCDHDVEPVLGMRRDFVTEVVPVNSGSAFCGRNPLVVTLPTRAKRPFSGDQKFKRHNSESNCR